MSQAKSNRWVVDPGAWPPVMSAQRNPISNIHALRMAYVETAGLEALLKASPSKVLGIVRHDRSPEEPNGFGACPVVYLDLPQFNGPPLAEVWTSTLPVIYHQAEGIHCAMNDEVLFGALQLEERPGTLLDSVTYNAYRRLLVQARALGYPICCGCGITFPRLAGIRRAGTVPALLCRPTPGPGRESFGFPSNPACGDCHWDDVWPANNPFPVREAPRNARRKSRQVSAYEYPRIYGPSSPSFARATLQPSISGAQLLIAGTASVVVM